MRKCGSCQLCCEVIAVKELGKPVNTRCINQAARGCSIYKTRPASCGEFTCEWLQGGLPGTMRPDRIGAVIWRYDQAFDGGAAKIRMIKVSCSSKRKIDKTVLTWVEQTSLRGPLFVEHGKNVYVYQDGKEIHAAHMGDRFDIEHNGRGKITSIAGIPI
jgi:hypothetical protein